MDDRRLNTMTVKIISADAMGIYFNNGSSITCDHEPDCCEYNYADFEQIEDLALRTEFDWPLTFEEVKGCGFRFGNRPQKMFFIPCYSVQNGYYSSDVDIYLDGEEVLNVECEMDDRY